MTETDKITKELHLKLVEAWWDGTLEQFCVDGEWRPAIIVPSSLSDPASYRIRPQPKLRPWKPEEVPVGAQLRARLSRARSLIVGVDSRQLYCGTPPTFCPLEMAFENFEHSLDGGKTWLPCGVEESQ